MFNPFAWIRDAAKAAVVNGVADGLRAVAPADAEPPADLADLMTRLEAASRTPALPAAADDTEPVKPARKK